MAQLDGFEESVREIAARQADALGREAIEAWVEVTNELLRNAPVGIGAPRSAEEWNLEAIAESVEIRQARGAGGQFTTGWEAEWTAETDDGIPLIDIFEFGVEGPYPIHGNPVLHWTDPETGEDIFRAKVMHPGIPAVAAVRIGKQRVEMAIERGDIEA